ncbi:hypothetical protein [Bacillus sp. 1P06AnD]|uniref:hypothetical protein n=1 Tax=Bacillus sp. 1P06AnD TaxID=3132208 RepID=UPI0039A17250
MHNQDTTKDDFLEAIFEVLKRLMKYYERNKEEQAKVLKVGEMANQNIEKQPDEKIKNFKEAMGEILKSDVPEEVKNIAKTFHDNPVESMAMLSHIVNENVLEKANELKQLTKESSDIISAIKLGVNMSNPNALDQLSELNNLENREKQKQYTANKVIEELTTNKLKNDIESQLQSKEQVTSKNENEKETENTSENEPEQDMER